MSSTLDLSGSTVTLNDDTTYTYYQVTDTSGSHNGTLILSEGTILEFDNKASAGFASAGSAITMNINGLKANNAQIRSADPSPTYDWSMPATTTYIDAEWCEFEHYSGSTSANYWGFSNCLFVGDRYISVDEMLETLNVTIEPIPLGRLIEASDRQIKAKLARLEVGAPTSDDKLKEASLHLTTAMLLTRYRMDGTKPSSLSLGSFSMSDNVDLAIKELKDYAWELVDSYALTHGTYDRYRWKFRKVND